LLHGDLAGAFALNPLLVLLSPVLAGSGSLGRARDDRARVANPSSGVSGFGCCWRDRRFSVVRNLPPR